MSQGAQKLVHSRKEKLHVSKTPLINANMEDQDAGVVGPRLQHGMPQHSQNSLGLAEWLVGHSVPLPCLYIPWPLCKVAPALQMSLNGLQASSVFRGWAQLPLSHSTKHFACKNEGQHGEFPNMEQGPSSLEAPSNPQAWPQLWRWRGDSTLETSFPNEQSLLHVSQTHHK